MDSLDNPQTFQNSCVVQKSSQTGFFSNKRLLVIKNGYLYYFSLVPKGYKLHVPNILSTFTQLPKSSIQIKTILQVRLQSAKSSSLMIKFFSKDMIDRQDLRKSIDTQNYSLQKKNTNDSDQWKFTFTTVLQCRLWYNALIKLRDHFKKQQNQFKEFLNNFQHRKNTIDKDNRSQSDLKASSASIMNIQKQQQGLLSIDHRKTQPIKFDPSKFITPKSQKSSLLEQQSKQSPHSFINSFLKDQKSQKNDQSPKKLSQNQNNLLNKEQLSVQKSLSQSVITKPVNEVVFNKSISQSAFSKPSYKTLKQSQLIIQPINQDQQIRIKQIQDQIRQQVQEQVRKQFYKKNQQQNKLMMQQIDNKNNQIKLLENLLQQNNIQNQQKIKIIQNDKINMQKKLKQGNEQLEKYKQNRILQNNPKNTNNQFNKYYTNNQYNTNNTNIQYNTISTNHQNNINNQNNQNNPKSNISNQNVTKKVQQNLKTKKQVVQTTQVVFQQQNQTIESGYKQPIDSSKKQIFHFTNEFTINTDQQAYQTDEYDPQLNLSKQLNLTKQMKVRNSFFSDYVNSNRATFNHQKKQNQNYQLNQDFQNHQFQGYNYFIQQATLFQKAISSQQRIDRQVKLLKYVKFIKLTAQKIVKSYIIKNKPKQSVIFEHGIFTFDLVCTPGKIMNIGGENKLIYSNKAHQRLKRQFKIYEYLQNSILKQLKNKQKFNIRVPLCTLIEYKGYSILAKLQQCYYQQTCQSSQLKHLISSQYHQHLKLSKLLSTNQIQSQLFIIKILQPFKITNVDKSSLLFKNQEDFDQKWIQQCRRDGISITSNKLEKQFTQLNYRQNTQINYHQNTQKNQRKVNLIKLMRQLKKIYKSIQPFSDQPHYNKSEFFQNFIKNPQYFIQLSPSNINFGSYQFHKQGYFYYLVQIFLGIHLRTNLNNIKTIKKNETTKTTKTNETNETNQNSQQKNVQQIQYEVSCVSRSFSLNNLICVQYCLKIPKQIQLHNMESALSSIQILNQTSTDQIKCSIYQIQLLLRNQQYQQVQQEIKTLRQDMTIHDLRRIQVDAVGIQAYLFRAQYTQAFKAIRQSLDFVEYMFSNTSNSYQTNLFLLMAETLLRIGNIQQAIKIYKALIKQKKIQKQSIFLSFGQIIDSNTNFDPNQTISLLNEFFDQVTKPIHKININRYLAKLYKKINRKDKVILHLEKAYQLSIFYRQYLVLLDTYSMLIKQSNKLEHKKIKYNKIVQSVDGMFFQKQQNCIEFNTINFQQIISHETLDTRAFILSYFIDISAHNKGQYNCSLKSWQDLTLFLNSILNQNKRINNDKFIQKIYSNLNINYLIQKLNNQQLNEQ